MATYTSDRSPLDRALSPAFTIQRASPSGQRVAVEQVQAHLTALLRAQLTDITPVIEAQAVVTEPTVRRFGGFNSAAALERHMAEWQIHQQNAAPQTMDLVIPVGNRFIAPPYDHDWMTGSALPLAKFDGAMLVFGSDGFSANGVSIILSCTDPLLTSITPQGTFDFSWVSFDNYPTLQSRGGLGLLVYANAEPTPIVQHQSVLWSLSGVTQFSSGQGSGRFADATVPSGGPFGPIAMAPVIINMLPGVNYEVWMWVWYVAHYGVANPAFLSFVRCKLPLVQLNAGPPIIIH
jgi:hypothetical protein